MMKPINDLISRFGVRVSFGEDLIVKKENRYFLLNKNLKRLIQEDFFYAGIYLGKIKKGKFFSSFNLLAMIAEKEAKQDSC